MIWQIVGQLARLVGLCALAKTTGEASRAMCMG